MSDFRIVMLSVLMLNVIMLSAAMLNVEALFLSVYVDDNGDNDRWKKKPFDLFHHRQARRSHAIKLSKM